MELLCSEVLRGIYFLGIPCSRKHWGKSGHEFFVAGNSHDPDFAVFLLRK